MSEAMDPPGVQASQLKRCKTCDKETRHKLLPPARSGDQFSCFQCHNCARFMSFCNSCPAVRSGNKAYKVCENMRNHCLVHNSEEGDLSHFANKESRDNDNSVFDTAGEFDFYISEHEAEEILNHSFTKPQMTFDGFTWPDYGVDETNDYMRSEIDLYHLHNQENGGFRQACWRARYTGDVFSANNVTSTEDAKFMFYMTSLLNNNTQTMNEKLYYVFQEIIEKTGASLEDTGVCIPKNNKEAEATFLSGKRAIYNNILSPEVHVIDKHACFKLTDVISLHLAEGRDVEYTEIPHAETGRSELRLKREIHGCQAMNDILDLMKIFDEVMDTQPTYYGYFTTWSDTFLRSYIKQKMNNVWLYIITLPGGEGISKTSPYYTYCVAVGSGHLDHSAVIDWYCPQIEELMRGRKYYCGTRKKIIFARFGHVAGMGDSPEQSFTNKTMHLGTYGKIARHAGEVRADVLSDCPKCYQNRLHEMFSNPDDPANLDLCHQCCQWDLESDSNAKKKIEPPDKYPVTAHPNSPEQPFGRRVGEKYIIPVLQTYAWLVKAVVFAAFNVGQGWWTRQVMEAYLRTCGVAASVRDKIWSHWNQKPES